LAPITLAWSDFDGASMCPTWQTLQASQDHRISDLKGYKNETFAKFLAATCSARDAQTKKSPRTASAVANALWPEGQKYHVLMRVATVAFGGLLVNHRRSGLQHFRKVQQLHFSPSCGGDTHDDTTSSFSIKFDLGRASKRRSIDIPRML